MIELKIEKLNDKLEKHYAEDENGVRYYITQVETGVEYDEAIDVIPCRYRYVLTNKVVSNLVEGQSIN